MTEETEHRSPEVRIHLTLQQALDMASSKAAALSAVLDALGESVIPAHILRAYVTDLSDLLERIDDSMARRS